MAKKVKAVVKIQIQGGKANPAPPVGTALGPHGINLMQFCKEYNAKTSSNVGQVIPVEVTVFQDGSFKFILKTPPAADLLKRQLASEAVQQNQIVIRWVKSHTHNYKKSLKSR